MKDKLKDDKFVKELLHKFLSVLIIAIVAILLLNVFSQSKDGRSQIIDEDGGSEYWETAFTKEEQRLTDILSEIKGVGEVKVMLTYESAEASTDIFGDKKKSENGKVKGAVVIASGGGKATTKKDISEAVMALFNIPVQNIKVFEGNEEGKNE